MHMTRKLTLDPDTLRVASFEAGLSLVEARGTVEGREAKIPCPWSYITSCQATYHTCASFDRSCRAE
jgi:hypothetical protein